MTAQCRIKPCEVGDWIAGLEARGFAETPRYNGAREWEHEDGSSLLMEEDGSAILVTSRPGIPEITREEWDAIPPEQKCGRPSDQPMILRLDRRTQETLLVPCKVKGYRRRR